MRSLIILSAFMACASAFSYDGFKLLRLRENSVTDTALLRLVHDAKNDDHARLVDSDKRQVYLPPGKAGERLLKRLEMEGVQYNVISEDVGAAHRQEREAIERRKAEFEKQGPSNRAVDFDILNFHTYEEIVQYLIDLANEHPEIVELESIGLTFEGYDQVIIKICSGICGDNPIMWLDSGIHSREWIGPSSTLYLIDYLVQGIFDEDLDLIFDFDWYIMPVVNVDGYRYTWSDDRNWRKTRQIYDFTTCIGADPNRNFPVGWGGEYGASANPCDITYFGPDFFSEPCTFNIGAYFEFVLSELNVIYYQNTHSAAELIMYPWGYKCNENDNPDAEDQDLIGNIGNDALAEVSLPGATPYQVGPICNIIYPATGGTVDWAYDPTWAGIKYAYSNELREGANHPIDIFLVDPEDIEPNGEEYFAFHAAVARAIRDNVTGND